jgi:prevent-host-death family protein
VEASVESISQRQMRNDSAAILRRVQAGESFVVTNRGEEVAKLVPFHDHDNADRADLIAQGILEARRVGHVELPEPVVSTIDLGVVLDADRSER